MNTSRRSGRLNTGRSNRAAANVLGGSSLAPKSSRGPTPRSVAAAASAAASSVPGSARAALSGRQSTGRIHTDVGRRQLLEPVFTETSEPSQVDPETKHDYVKGEARAYRMYEAETPISKDEGRKIGEARCYTDPSCITPTWLKVSATPWYAPSKATGGYGRKIHDTSVSYDAPAIFHVDCLEEHDEEAARRANGSIAHRRVKRDGDSPMRRSVSQDAPDFFHLQCREPPTTNLKYTKMIYKKQVMFEPPTPRSACFDDTPRHLLPSCRSLRGEAAALREE